jgi:hypothetical protein
LLCIIISHLSTIDLHHSSHLSTIGMNHSIPVHDCQSSPRTRDLLEAVDPLFALVALPADVDHPKLQPADGKDGLHNAGRAGGGSGGVAVVLGSLERGE